MASASHHLSHLSGLIEAAYREAERLPGLDATAALLRQALAEVNNLMAHGGRPDEGTPPSDLTTENDR